MVKNMVTIAVIATYVGVTIISYENLFYLIRNKKKFRPQEFGFGLKQQRSLKTLSLNQSVTKFIQL